MEAETVVSRQVSDYSTDRNLMLDFEAEFSAFLNRDFPETVSRP
jgi:hypothetical protein